ncbi:MAG: hypothetical protein JRG92_21975 [Deltaproteobacteria bacterium]|jgi:hypothetical protein|nr:hypothetical protein [Deltaproteobacteria bacterium]MBW2386306.1 hypothetical protein [Deltaproteobacteria bacterium]MBW2695091.1 hypothetical protein [Deltaproteobacteria bacterium]
MPTDPRVESSPDGPSIEKDPIDPKRALIRDELDRRLRLFDTLDDSAFGDFTTVDWTLCTLFFFVLPLLIAWWAF